MPILNNDQQYVQTIKGNGYWRISTEGEGEGERKRKHFN